MADWDEIKKLAADFQRTQASDTLAKISDRNCVDIVKKLIELKLIDVIFSCDGKEIITSQHLTKEIEDEVYVAGGRAHLSDLAATLNVDHQNVSNTANELVRDKPDEYNLILGQLIHSNYKATLAEQIGQWMLANEQLSISDFAKKLDLPSEFLLSMVKDCLPKMVDDFVVSADGRTFYTAELMHRYKSIVAGTLSAIWTPTNLTSVMKRIDIPETIFMSLVDELIKEGRIEAILEDKILTPNIYIRKQNEYVDKFFASNFYIEYDMLFRIHIKQPQAFLKRRFPQGVPLKTCFVGQEMLIQIEGLIEDAISSSSWIDISSVIPPALQAEDIQEVIERLFKTNKNFKSSSLLFNQTIVCSLAFIETCRNKLTNLMQDKAKEQLKQGKLMNHFLGVPVKPPKEPKNIDKEKKRVEEKDKENLTAASKEAESTVPKPQKEEEKIQPESSLNKDQTTGVDDQSYKNKKSKRAAKTNDVSDESDEDYKSSKKSSKDKKSGTSGREVKQKAVKKKYLPGNKGASKGNNQSDDEGTAPVKAPRSNKGRAARRAMSPERPSTSDKAKDVKPVKEPLTFMNTHEIAGCIKVETRGDDEFPDDFLESLAEMIESDLNSTYEKVAKQTLDEYIVSKNNEEGAGCEEDENQEIQLVE